MKLHLVVLFALASVLCCVEFVHCEEKEDPSLTVEDEPTGMNEQQPDPAEVERLKQLFQTLSPECAQEVEAAYSGGGEVSDACKMQIQERLAQAGGNPGAGAANQEKKDLPDPTFKILAFVFALIAGLVGWGVYAQMTIVSKIPPQPVKKLSKQKLAKQRMKEQQNAGIE